MKIKGLRGLMIALALSFVVVLAGCGGTKEEKKAEPKAEGPKGKIVIATKPFAEQFILGNMAAELLKAKTKLEVDTSKIGMGPTEMLHPALEKGQIDIYPEYTGTAWMTVLKQPVIHDRKEIYEKTKAAYAEKFKIEWLPSLGFQNTFAIAVTKETADKLQLKKISDLANHKGLTYVGDAVAFKREDAYPGLKKAYGLDYKEKVVDVNFFYEALKQKQGDVVTVFSTDGRLKQYSLVVLEDDKNFFPPYDLAFLVRQETLTKYPEIKEALKPINNAIDDKTMTDLNYQVEVEKKDPAEVAKAFLKAKGMI